MVTVLSCLSTVNRLQQYTDHRRHYMDKGCIQELFERAVGVIMGEEMVNTW